jgi:hypothetical protein
MSAQGTAAELAKAQVAAVRDDPMARLKLLEETYRGPTGDAPRHLPYRRAAVAFMQWQVQRGVLEPMNSTPPGSAWWRAVNERLLRDGCESVSLAGGNGGAPSSRTVELWLEFIDQPSGKRWYRAHNSSIVAGYIENRPLARDESPAERFFMNVALLRVLYAHALVGAPRLALGKTAVLGPLLGDPRLGMAGAFLSLGRVLPERYPLEADVSRYSSQENRLGRLLDYAVIAPRLQGLYEWSAENLGHPELSSFVQEGSPVYEWSFDDRAVWSSNRKTPLGRALSAVTMPSKITA